MRSALAGRCVSERRSWLGLVTNAVAATAHVAVVADVPGMRVVQRTARADLGFALVREPPMAAVGAASAVVYTQPRSFIA